MKNLKIRNLILFTFALFLATSCASESEYGVTQESLSKESYAEESVALADEMPLDYKAVGDTALPPGQKDAFASRLNLPRDRQFIRKVETRFRVKDVRKASRSIEDLSARFGGFITKTELRSYVQEVREDVLSQDSLLRTSIYRMENAISLRVPNEKMDSLIRSLNPLLVFLDYRTLSAEDVSLSIKAYEMQKARNQTSENRIANVIDETPADLGDRLEGERQLINRQNQSDAAAINQLRVEDQVLYSTVQLYIYQENVSHQEKVAYFPPQRPGFGEQLWEAFSFSFEVVEAIFLMAVRLWMLILLGVGLFFLRKYLIKKEKI
ncbi:MAG: DUF4349 domain-containing protein [Bacteroidota bacterium]